MLGGVPWLAVFIFSLLLPLKLDGSSMSYWAVSETHVYQPSQQANGHHGTAQHTTQVFTPLIIAAIVIVGVFVWSSVVLVKARRAGEVSSGGYNTAVRSDLPSHLYQDAYRTSCPMLVLSSVCASLTHSQAVMPHAHTAHPVLFHLAMQAPRDPRVGVAGTQLVCVCLSLLALPILAAAKASGGKPWLVACTPLQHPLLNHSTLALLLFCSYWSLSALGAGLDAHVDALLLRLLHALCLGIGERRQRLGVMHDDWSGYRRKSQRNTGSVYRQGESGIATDTFPLHPFFRSLQSIACFFLPMAVMAVISADIVHIPLYLTFIPLWVVNG